MGWGVGGKQSGPKVGTATVPTKVCGVAHLSEHVAYLRMEALCTDDVLVNATFTTRNESEGLTGAVDRLYVLHIRLCHLFFQRMQSFDLRASRH